MIHKYKKKVYNWLSKEFINVNRDRSNEEASIHVDEFTIEKKDYTFFLEGIEIFKALVELSKENDWDGVVTS